MSAPAHYLAFDLGASSGRAILGRFDGTRLMLEELHRFDNEPVDDGGRLYWNALGLLDELKTGLARCTQRGIELDAFGIDTWGVDFALLAPGGELLDRPRHYRDPRTCGMMERAFQRHPRERIYERTGLQFMPLNTLYQLLAEACSPARLLDHADRLLFMPDLFAYWLTGATATERSIASTSQMVDACTGAWAVDMLDLLGLPTHILPPIRPAGSLGPPLLPDVTDDVGQAGTRLIHTACHDTQAAIAAMPARQPGWAYISSGTWSLVGVELSAPLITPATLAADFTNEAGVDGTTCFLRNVPGLWLVQECRRTWAAAGQPYTHAQLAQMAGGAAPLRSFIRPDDPRFSAPGDMPGRIRSACQESGQAEPDSPGAVVRCALESLALEYRRVLTTLESLLGRAIEVIHVAGGGARNELLNQFTADATGKPVIAGPIEAAAAGNIMVQALAQRRVANVAELRQVIAASSELRHFEPHDGAAWMEAYGRFQTLPVRV